MSSYYLPKHKPVTLFSKTYSPIVMTVTRELYMQHIRGWNQALLAVTLNGEDALSGTNKGLVHYNVSSEEYKAAMAAHRKRMRRNTWSAFLKRALKDTAWSQEAWALREWIESAEKLLRTAGVKV